MRNLLLMLVAFVCAVLTSLSCSRTGSGSVTVSLKSVSDTSRERRAVGDFGEGTVGSSGVSSFKFYIRDIQVCNTITINGSGYSNPQGCEFLYTNPQTDNYDTFLYDEAVAADDSKYTDILSEAGLAGLSSSVSIDEGTYNYGIINWYRPVKITASISNGNGVTFRTQSGGTYDSSTDVVTVSDLTAGSSATEMVAFLSNGGTYFRFQQPFVVSTGSTYTLDLAFNANGTVKAGASVSNQTIMDNSGNGILVPMMDIAPIPRATTEQTMLETYTLTGESQFNLRVEVYYNSADSSKSVQGATITQLYTSSTDNMFAGVFKIKEVTFDGTNYTFLSETGQTILSNFTRSSTGGTATFACDSDSCSSAGDATLTYTAPTVTTIE